MRIAFVCASVDVKNAVVGDTLDRAFTISQHQSVSELSIISLHGKGSWKVRGLKAYGVGSDYGSRLFTLLSFIKILYFYFKNEKPDVIYLYMCPTLAPIIYPFKIFFKFKIVSWFGHTIYTMPTRVSLKYFTDLWFNSNRSMAPFTVPHLRLVGQGVMPDQFFYDPSITKKFDLITVGRLTPIKKIEQMFDVLVFCRENFSVKYTLNICGDAFVSSDISYKNFLYQRVDELKLRDQVTFSGMVARDNLASLLQEARVFLFLINGGVGKAPLEGMACGVPVIISSLQASDFIGEELSKWFLCSTDTESVAKAVHRLLSLNNEEYVRLSQKAYSLFQEKYTMKKFINRIVTNISEVLG